MSHISMNYGDVPTCSNAASDTPCRQVLQHAQMCFSHYTYSHRTLPIGEMWLVDHWLDHSDLPGHYQNAYSLI